jgi:hypothetical protein
VRALLAESNPGSGLTFKVKSPHNHISYAMLTEALLRDFTARRYKPLPTVAQMFQSIYDALAQTQAHRLLVCSEMFSQYRTCKPAMVTQLLDVLENADVSL